MRRRASGSLTCLLLCSLLFGSESAVAQTTPTPPTTPPQTTTQHTTPKQKPTPVVKPHGETHAVKPPPQKPAASAVPSPPVPTTPPAPAVVPPAKPVPEQDPNKGSVTQLPIPRFVSLRSEEVYLRAGPGTRYPIEWVYKRRDLPVEILREFDVWRLVQDPDGIKGWMHQATLSGRRSFVVTGADATLRHDPQETAAAVAILKVGVIGRLRSCAAGADWCQVQVGDYRGYLPRSAFWGTLPSEVVAGG
jgi:SH3-like domain-containing protein